MFDIGWTEFLLVAAVAIIVIGPEDMPHILYKLGKIARKIKVFTADIQRSIENITREAEVEDIAREVNRDIGGPGVDFEAEKQAALEERARASKDKPDILKDDADD